MILTLPTSNIAGTWVEVRMRLALQETHRVILARESIESTFRVEKGDEIRCEHQCVLEMLKSDSDSPVEGNLRVTFSIVDKAQNIDGDISIADSAECVLNLIDDTAQTKSRMDIQGQIVEICKQIDAMKQQKNVADTKRQECQEAYINFKQACVKENPGLETRLPPR